MEDITKLIQIENTESDACGNNGSNDSFSWLSYNKFKLKQLKVDITSSLKVELKGWLNKTARK